MKVDDLYIIIRELNKIATLQANLLAMIKLLDKKGDTYNKQLQASDKLRKLVKEYERFNI